MERCFYAIFLLSAILLKGCKSVDITDITVPSFFVIDNNDDFSKNISLGCIFNLHSEDGTSLVVKWYKDEELIYQCIDGRIPTIVAQFRDQVDVDADHQCSSVTLINLSTDTTGTYRCVVQTAGGTDAEEQHLQLIDIRNISHSLTVHRIQNETQIECIVDNVFPEPLLIIDTVDDDEEVRVINEVVNDDENGLFNATTVVVISDDDIDDDEYTCTLSFTHSPYNLTFRAYSSGVRLGQLSLVQQLISLITVLATWHTFTCK